LITWKMKGAIVYKTPRGGLQNDAPVSGCARAKNKQQCVRGLMTGLITVGQAIDMPQHKKGNRDTKRTS
jgi:hypothetical protein